MGVDSDVAGDGEQPRPHGSTLLVECLGMPPGPQQRLLYDVLRSTAVTGGEAQGVGHQRRRMLIEERAQSRVLGRSHCDHHITVTHPAPHRFSVHHRTAQFDGWRTSPEAVADTSMPALVAFAPTRAIRNGRPDSGMVKSSPCPTATTRSLPRTSTLPLADALTVWPATVTLPVTLTCPSSPSLTDRWCPDR